MLAKWNCDVRGSSFCGSDYVAILGEEARGVPISREDDSGSFDLSTVGVHGISSVVIIRFDRCHGGVCL